MDELDPSLGHEPGHELGPVMTSNLPPKSGYSFASVLKQWGQFVTIFVTP